MGFIIIISPAFIGFIGSAARAASGSEAAIAKANAAPMPSVILDTVLLVVIFISSSFSSLWRASLTASLLTCSIQAT
jgi:hypothetical protein